MEEIQAVLNPGIIKDFNSYVKKITQRQKEKPELFKKMDWLAQADHATKKEVLSRYENLVKSKPPCNSAFSLSQSSIGTITTTNYQSFQSYMAPTSKSPSRFATLDLLR